MKFTRNISNGNALNVEVFLCLMRFLTSMLGNLTYKVMNFQKIAQI